MPRSAGRQSERIRQKNRPLVFAVGIVVLCLVLQSKIFSATKVKSSQARIPTTVTEKLLTKKPFPEKLPAKNPASGNSMYYSEILGQDFTLVIKENPIDQWWYSISEEVNVYSMIQAYQEYCTYWENEMQNAVCILRSELNEQDYQVLCDTQTSWKEYVENDFLIKQGLYYLNSSYKTGDGYTYSMVFAEKAKETKRRAVELLSYVYTLTGKIEFVFSPVRVGQ